MKSNLLFTKLEITSEKIVFHVGEKLNLFTNDDGDLIANTESLEYSNLPCLELTIKRESLSNLISSFDKTASDKLLDETLDLNWKIEIPEYNISL